MNVSWAPYAGTTPKNPGESFYVRYRKKGIIANCDLQQYNLRLYMIYNYDLQYYYLYPV